MSAAEFIIAAIIVVASIQLIKYVFEHLKKPPLTPTPAHPEPPTKSKKKKKKPSAQTAKPKPLPSKKKKKKGKASKAHTEIHHPLRVASLAGHSEAITGASFSPSGKLLATSSEDRTLRVWNVSDLGASRVPYARVAIDLDHASSVAFATSGKALAVTTSDRKHVALYSVREDGSTPAGVVLDEAARAPLDHKQDVGTLLFAPKDAFLATCASGGTDTNVHLFDPRKLDAPMRTIDSHQLRNHRATLSQDGRFFAISTMLSDLRIFEFSYSNDGKFAENKGVVMDLDGHKKGVHDVAFSRDNTRAFTVDGEGVLRSWDLAVRYEVNEDAHLLQERATEAEGGLEHVALLEPKKGRAVVAVATAGLLLFLDAESGDELDRVQGIHADGFRGMHASPDGQHLVTFGNDKHIYIFARPE